jgi:hypothetical protein
MARQRKGQYDETRFDHPLVVRLLLFDGRRRVGPGTRWLHLDDGQRRRAALRRRSNRPANFERELASPGFSFCGNVRSRPSPWPARAHAAGIQRAGFITYKGFKGLAFLGGISDTVFARLRPEQNVLDREVDDRSDDAGNGGVPGDDRGHGDDAATAGPGGAGR